MAGRGFRSKATTTVIAQDEIRLGCKTSIKGFLRDSSSVFKRGDPAGQRLDRGAASRVEIHEAKRADRFFFFLHPSLAYRTTIH